MGIFISEALDQIETLDAASSWHFIETIKMQGKRNDTTDEFYENMWKDKKTFSLMGGDFETYPLLNRGHSVHQEIGEFEEICLSLAESGSWQIARNLLLVFGNGFHENGWDWETWNLYTIMQFIAAECAMASGVDIDRFWSNSKVQFVETEQLSQHEGLQLFETSFIIRTSRFIEALTILKSFQLDPDESQSEVSTLVSKASTLDLDLDFVLALSLSLICRTEEDFVRDCSEILKANSAAFQNLETIHWKTSEFLDTGDKHEMDIPEILITYSFNGPGKFANSEIQDSPFRNSLMKKLKSLDNLIEEKG